MNDADPVAASLEEIAAHMLFELPEPGGDILALRERHLCAATHAVLGRRLKTAVISRVIALPEWPLLGRSATDFVVDWPPGAARGRPGIPCSAAATTATPVTSQPESAPSR